MFNENTKNKNLFGTNYVGHNNPKNTNGNDNYSLPPINEADANALEHDLRYDNMKVSGLRGLLKETSAILQIMTLYSNSLKQHFYHLIIYKIQQLE